MTVTPGRPRALRADDGHSEAMTGAFAGPAPACSDWARSQDLSPVGSAGHYRGYLLVELPLPWPADISEVAELADVVKLADGAGLRLQAIAAAGPSPVGDEEREDDQAPEARRLIYYRTARAGWAGPLGRRELLAVPGRQTLAEGAAELLDADTGQPGGPGPAPAPGLGPGPGPGGPGPGPGGVDVLVCTHGRRDTCCGGRGMELVRAVAAAGMVAGPEVRLWRTSHTGGHRFAPTALVLPSATLWAWVDVPLLDRVVRAEGAMADVLSRYRGCATLGPPAHQAVEKSVLAQVGWPLLSSRRRASAVGDGRVRLETESFGTWEARPTEGRHVPQPECRTPPGLAVKQSVEWVVDEVRQVVPA